MTTLKVSSPAELISAVPYLIGFHPADSLTVVAMRAHQVAFAVRIDLPELSAPVEEARAAVLHLASVVAQQEVQAVTLIGYGEAARVTPAVLRLSDAFRRIGLIILDELRVEGGRYWSYLCTDPSCCPAEGRRCDPGASVVAAEATFAGAVALPSREALAAQLAPATGADREAMIAATARAGIRLAALAGDRRRSTGNVPNAPEQDVRVAPEQDVRVAPEQGARDAAEQDVRVAPEQGARDAAEQGVCDAPEQGVRAEAGSGPLAVAQYGTATGPAGEGRQPGPAGLGLGGAGSPFVSDEPRFYRLVRRAGRAAVRDAERRYRSGRRLTDDEAAWLGLLLLHLPVRDYAWTRTRQQEWEVALWSDVLRRVEPRYAPAPASLLAFVAWRSGLGALASIAAERALEQEADYSLAVLLREALLCGLPPSVLDGWPAVTTEPWTEGRSAADAEGGINGRSAADAEGGINGRSAADAEGGINGRSAADAEPGINGRSAAEAEPGIKVRSAADAEPGIKVRSAADAEPGIKVRSAADGRLSSSRAEAAGKPHPRRPNDGGSAGRKERPRRPSRRRI
jgi:hypothetical protein